MAVPEEHTTKVVPPAPSAFSVASTGAAAFQSWLEEEEEEWRLGRMLEAKCPKEFTCPISLDIMADPVILVETGMTYDRHNIRKWLLLGGSTCPLTGVKLITRKVASHKHLRQRIDCWVATGGSMPADSVATLAEGPRVCASEASYQVLSQGPPRADSCAVPDSPRADSVATSAGHVSAVRRRACMFERAPSEASSMGLRRQRSGRHGAPRMGVPPPVRQAQPNVSRSSMLLCKLSSSALSKLTAGSSRATTPMASPRSGGEEEEAGEQHGRVDTLIDSGPADLPAARAVAVTAEAQRNVFEGKSGTAAASPAASKGDAAAVANLTHHDMPAPPSTPKTPVAAGNHSSDRASTLRAAQQQEEGTQAAGWAMFRAHGLHMDQSMLAQAHAAMLTIEMEGWTPEVEMATEHKSQERQCANPGVANQDAVDKQVAEEPHGQSCPDAVPAAAPEQEGEDHAQDQSEVLAALEEALADDVPSSKELIVAADPGATGGSTKSSSTGSANISVIATADMIVRRPRSRVNCLGGGLQPRRSASGRCQVVPGALYLGPAPTSNRHASAPGRHRRDGSVAPLQKLQASSEQPELISLPPRAQSRAAPQGSGWARCFGCNVPPSLRPRGDRSGAVSRVASARVDHWVEGSDEEIVTMDNFARHVIAAAAKQDAAAAAEKKAAAA